MADYLVNLESPSRKDTLRQVWLKLVQCQIPYLFYITYTLPDFVFLVVFFA